MLHGEGTGVAAEQGVDLPGLLQGDGGAGDGGGAALDGGVDGIGNVVVDDDRSSTGQSAVGVLVGEGDAVAAGHQDHLAGHVSKVGSIAAVDGQVGLLAAGEQRAGVADEDGLEGDALAHGIQGDPGLVEAALNALHPEFLVGEGGLQIGDQAHVVGGGHAEGVGIGGRLGGGVGAALVGVHHVVGQIIVGPVAGVACGGTHDDAGAGQALHQTIDVGGVGGGDLMGGGEAGVGAAQGQVDAGAAQQHGILGGGHVVGGISAAGGAEDLHGDDLGVGSNAGDANQLSGLGIVTGLQGVQQSGDVLLVHLAVGVQVGGVQVLGLAAQDHMIHQQLGIVQAGLAVAVQVAELVNGDEAVGGGDTGDVGAVGTHVVEVVADVQIAVHIVEVEGHLGVAVQLLGGQAREALAHVQVGQDLGDVVSIDQAQGLHVCIQLHAGSGGILGQGVLEALGGEGLVIGVRAGVNDSDGGACTVVAVGVLGHIGTGHLLGHDVVLLGSLGMVDSLQIDALNAFDTGDLLDVAVADVGGDGVGNQGQVPDHVQLLALQGLLGDGGSDLILPGLQLGAVGNGVGVGQEALAGLDLADGGLALQDDGHADHVGVGVVLLVLVLDDGLIPDEISADGIELLEGDILLGSLNAGDAQTQDHDQSQGQCQGTGDDVVSHVPSLP